MTTTHSTEIAPPWHTHGTAMEQIWSKKVVPAAKMASAVRKLLVQPSAMTQPGTRRLFRKRRVRSYVTRGSVYCWLRAYHTEVAAALAREEYSWAVLVADMAIDGVRGRGGAEVTANAALRVWQRVQRDVEADAVAEAAKAPPIGGKYPSRISPQSRPQVVSPQPVRQPPPVPVIPSPLPSTPASVASAPARLHGSVPILIDIPEAERVRVQATLDKAMDQLIEMGRKIYGG